MIPKPSVFLGCDGCAWINPPFTIHFEQSTPYNLVKSMWNMICLKASNNVWLLPKLSISTHKYFGYWCPTLAPNFRDHTKYLKGYYETNSFSIHDVIIYIPVFSKNGLAPQNLNFRLFKVQKFLNVTLYLFCILF